jgi:hypothetical protein
MSTDREIDRWRKKAEANMAQANRLFEVLMFAAKELVRLTHMHQPDDFAHCPVCKVPWPCDTAQEVRKLSQVFDRYHNNDKESKESKK